MSFDLSQLEKVAGGKTKDVYQHPDNEGWYILHFKDDITAGDGEKHDVMTGKGAINCETSSLIMAYLNSKEMPTHFVEQAGEGLQIVKKVEMIPLECISRQFAYGSMLKRFPFFEKGQRLDEITFETDFKNDAEHDPAINEQFAVLGKILAPGEYDTLQQYTVEIFSVLSDAFEGLGSTLVDYKVEFGRVIQGGKNTGQIVLGDELTNDSWRVWPGGKEEHMLDKEVYRQTGDVKKAKIGYEKMLELVRQF